MLRHEGMGLGQVGMVLWHMAMGGDGVATLGDRVGTGLGH